MRFIWCEVVNNDNVENNTETQYNIHAPITEESLGSSSINQLTNININEIIPSNMILAPAPNVISNNSESSLIKYIDRIYIEIPLLNHNNMHKQESIDINNFSFKYNIYAQIKILQKNNLNAKAVVGVNSIFHMILPSYFMYLQYKQNISIICGDSDMFTYHFYKKISNIYSNYIIFNQYFNNNIKINILHRYIPKIGLYLHCHIRDIEDIIHLINIDLLVTYGSYNEFLPYVLLSLKSQEIDIISGFMFNKFFLTTINFFHDKKYYKNSVVDCLLSHYNKLYYNIQISCEYILNLLSQMKINNKFNVYILRYIYINILYNDKICYHMVLQFIIHSFMKNIDDLKTHITFIMKIYINHEGFRRIEIFSCIKIIPAFKSHRNLELL